VVLVVTLGTRTIAGAVNAAAAFALFEPVVLKGTIFGWILRSPARIPGVFPVSAKWTFILFGLGAVQYARHPEGIVEYRMHQRAAKAEQRRTAQAERRSPPAPDDAESRSKEPVS